MVDQMNSDVQRYALLIGIDFYHKNNLPEGSFGHLYGCVRDVSHIEGFLKSRLRVPEEQIFKLTASHDEGQAPAEPPDKQPSYENIVAAFKRLTEMAEAGNHVYIHYSGHGGRAKTIFPEIKGKNGIDEGLVPTNIGEPGARYLRDVELARLLKEMVAKGLVVTVVLDSCHSGGLTRGDVGVRGRAFVDATERPTESLVASGEELVNLWREITGEGARNVTAGSGWLPEPQGYTLLAACRSTELAYEAVFDEESGERNGALTYWLLNSLQDIGPGLSYKVVHDRILGKVHGRFEQQTPILQGEGDRVVFGTERVAPHYAVPVVKVEEDRVRLEAGQVHGLRRGAQFAIYQHGTTDFTNKSLQQAIVEIKNHADLGGTDSWATIIKRTGERPIEEGDQALLLGTGNVRLVQKVALVDNRPATEVPPSIDQSAVMLAVRQALEANAWVEVAEDNKGVAYQVVVNKAGEYEIGDMAGEPIKNLRPPIRIGEANAPEQVAQRLEHLARYQAVIQLSNADQRSPLAHRLTVDLLGRASDYDPADAFQPEETFAAQGNVPTLGVGEWTALRIHNGTSVDLNIAVLDLQPDWGITQVYPGGAESFVTLDAGDERIIPLQGDLPEGYTEGIDIIKVFATRGTTNFRWLELPSLDKPRSRTRDISRSATGPQDELERLLAVVASDRPTRNLRPATSPTFEWVTEQVQLRVERLNRRDNE